MLLLVCPFLFSVAPKQVAVVVCENAVRLQASVSFMPWRCSVNFIMLAKCMKISCSFYPRKYS